MNNKVTDPNLQSILTALQKLSQVDRLIIAQALQSKPSSLLKQPIDGYEDWRSELRLRGLAEGTIELYSRTVRKLLGQYPVPTSRDIRAYLSGRLGVVTPQRSGMTRKLSEASLASLRSKTYGLITQSKL